METATTESFPAGQLAFTTEQEIITANHAPVFANYLKKNTLAPLLLLGDCLAVLKALPADSMDCCMTSPPYWGKRQYAEEGIGLERDYRDYVNALLAVFTEVKRVLKPSGSLWLNLGDSYADKKLLGLPWRVALALCDEQGWTLRNSVIWNKVKGAPDNTKDRLRNVHENLFHLVESPKAYYYDTDAVRQNPKQTKVVNGAVVSATGVSGVRYKRQLELSTALNEDERSAAFAELEKVLQQVQNGELADFRMIIRGNQRVTHSDSEKVSGRAKELRDKGFYFLRYHPNGAKLGDVWDILPEDTQKREAHFAPYPVDLCKIPLAATCPPGGIVLDPFAGTGTTLVAARLLGRKSVGIELSRVYLEQAQARCGALL